MSAWIETASYLHIVYYKWVALLVSAWIETYCNPDWIEWVAKAVEDELYNENGPNNGRAYTNVKAVYDNIKLDFYHRLNR